MRLTALVNVFEINTRDYHLEYMYREMNNNMCPHTLKQETDRQGERIEIDISRASNSCQTNYKVSCKSLDNYCGNRDILLSNLLYQVKKHDDNKHTHRLCSWMSVNNPFNASKLITPPTLIEYIGILAYSLSVPFSWH